LIEREPIYSALYDLIYSLKTSLAVKTVGRRLRHWADVSPVEQPAVFVVQKRERPEQIRLVPTKWMLEVELYVYVNSGDDPQSSPAEILNPILDQIEALFPPSDEEGQIQTLGGLVSHCWISGIIDTAEGVLGQQEVAIVPLEILIT
jgi:hypothetical protein